MVSERGDVVAIMAAIIYASRMGGESGRESSKVVLERIAAEAHDLHNAVSNSKGGPFFGRAM